MAFSREDPSAKVYVQHLMAQHGQQLAGMVLQQGGSVFVCGDGMHMAKDVHQCLCDIFEKHGGLSAAEATAKLQEMARDKRYVRDIWA